MMESIKIIPDHKKENGRQVPLLAYYKKTAFNKKKGLFTNKLDLYLRKKLVKCYI
jgi:hypothetical protein